MSFRHIWQHIHLGLMCESLVLMDKEILMQDISQKFGILKASPVNKANMVHVQDRLTYEISHVFKQHPT
jgi:hypothetical protein